MLLGFSYCLLLFTCVSAIVIDSPTEYPSGWHIDGVTNPSQRIHLLFAIKQQNIDLFLHRLDQISSPSSDDYGKWLSMEDINAMIAPANKSLMIVQNWLLTHPQIDESMISSVTPNSDFIQVVTNVEVASQLLGCRYFDYSYSYSYSDDIERPIIVSRMSTDCDYHVPDYVSSHLDFIEPTKRFHPTDHFLKPIANKNEIDYRLVTPSLLKELYNVGDVKGERGNNSQGVASFDRYYSTQDLEIFWDRFNISYDIVTHTNPKDGNGTIYFEPILDTEYITAMGEKIALQVWDTTGDFTDAMLEFLLSIQNLTNPPLLFSISYGLPETMWGSSYIQRVNIEFAKVTALGISIFVAAGDYGAGGNCFKDEIFNPYYPASSPYITSVGGVTNGNPNGNGNGSSFINETVWIQGGGGFSNVASIQSWQSEVVENYFNTINNNCLPNSNQYNRSGRGYPDISAQSRHFEIIFAGEPLPISGTSCSSPTVAGIFALLNDLRLKNNMAPLGYLNPLIYQIGMQDSSVFNDVIYGYNRGCILEDDEFDCGFYASKGWDPASGFGSPNYQILAQYVIQTGQKTKQYT